MEAATTLFSAFENHVGRAGSIINNINNKVQISVTLYIPHMSQKISMRWNPNKFLFEMQTLVKWAAIVEVYLMRFETMFYLNLVLFIY